MPDDTNDQQKINETEFEMDDTNDQQKINETEFEI